MSLLPTDGYPFYDIGWSLQHEMAFYVMAAGLIPWFGLAGLAIFLAASTLAFHLLDLPWYLATLANHHGEFLAGVLAFMMRDKIARFGFLLPFAIGAVLLGYLSDALNPDVVSDRVVFSDLRVRKFEPRRTVLVAETCDETWRRFLFNLPDPSPGVPGRLGGGQPTARRSALVSGTNPSCLPCRHCDDLPPELGIL